jgi:hypothetical protein
MPEAAARTVVAIMIVVVRHWPLTQGIIAEA